VGKKINYGEQSFNKDDQRTLSTADYMHEALSMVHARTCTHVVSVDSLRGPSSINYMTLFNCNQLIYSESFKRNRKGSRDIHLWIPCQCIELRTLWARNPLYVDRVSSRKKKFGVEVGVAVSCTIPPPPKITIVCITMSCHGFD
jgi:hypothetical protein